MQASAAAAPTTTNYIFQAKLIATAQVAIAEHSPAQSLPFSAASVWMQLTTAAARSADLDA